MRERQVTAWLVHFHKPPAAMLRPPRLRSFNDIGPFAVFVTMTTRSRHEAFLSDQTAEYGVDQFRGTEVPSYTRMWPDWRPGSTL
jgi:hypothetical protein